MPESLDYSIKRKKEQNYVILLMQKIKETTKINNNTDYW